MSDTKTSKESAVLAKERTAKIKPCDHENFAPLKNDVMLRALRCQSVPYTPVWLMRQAGRYLPEYRAVRAKAGEFMNLCRTPELACEVTLQPLERYALDAAILFSDILTIPDALDLGLTFVAGEGPCIRKPIRTEQDVVALPPQYVATDLDYVMQAVSLIRKELNGRVPLIGFTGSPWTLATYMVEGGSSKDFRQIKRMLYESPEVMLLLLDKLAQMVTEYLKAQIRAGAQILQIFDTWGGVLSTPDFHRFSFAFIQQIVQNLKQDEQCCDIPIISFTKYGGLWFETVAQSGVNAVGLDWTVELSDVVQRRQQLGLEKSVALQGNIDPAVLYATPAAINKEVARILESIGTSDGHIFNLGHGVPQDVSPDRVRCLVDAVHELSMR